MILRPFSGDSGTYLFDNGFIGYLDSDVGGDSYNVMKIDFFGPNGEFKSKGKLNYRGGMTLGELCESKGLPQPVTKIPDLFHEALGYNDCDTKRVFKVLDAYLTGRYSDSAIQNMLWDCQRDSKKSWRFRP